MMELAHGTSFISNNTICAFTHDIKGARIAVYLPSNLLDLDNPSIIFDGCQDEDSLMIDCINCFTGPAPNSVAFLQKVLAKIYDGRAAQYSENTDSLQLYWDAIVETIKEIGVSV